MNANEPFGPSKLILAALDDEPAAQPARSVAKPVFHANTREGGDRRLHADRREMLRFQADRRSGQDRRPRVTWERGKNL